MLDKVAGTILLFKNFILVAVPVQVLIMLLIWFCTRRFSWSRRKRLLYGWFLNRTDKELLYTGAALCQLLFVLSGALTGMEMELAHLMFFLVLAILKLAARPEILVFLRDVINSGLMFASLVVGNILLGYLKETRFNIFVVTVLVLLGVFLVFYQGYFFMKDIGLSESAGQSRIKGRKLPSKSR